MVYHRVLDINFCKYRTLYNADVQILSEWMYKYFNLENLAQLDQSSQRSKMWKT